LGGTRLRGEPKKQKPGTPEGSEDDEARRSRAARANGPEKPGERAGAGIR